MRFTIEHRQWYAMELISDEFDPGIRAYSPIRVNEIRPLKSGKRNFKLDFHHSNYPAGVQGKHYSLKTIERGKEYILAKSTSTTPKRLLLIYNIDWAWLDKHFGGWMKNCPEEKKGRKASRSFWVNTHK